MPRFAAAVTAVLIGLAAALVPASPAAAHARLLGSTPADGSTATRPIAEIRLRFSEPVRQNLTTVRITGPGGTAHGAGDPVVVDATVTQAVAALPTGVMRVGWRTVSVDGHTIQGSFSFTNRAAAAGPAPPASAAPVASTPAPPATVASPTRSGTAGRVGVVAAVVGALLAAAGALWWRRRRASTG